MVRCPAAQEQAPCRIIVPGGKEENTGNASAFSDKLITGVEEMISTNPVRPCRPSNGPRLAEPCANPPRVRGSFPVGFPWSESNKSFKGRKIRVNAPTPQAQLRRYPLKSHERSPDAMASPALHADPVRRHARPIHQYNSPRGRLAIQAWRTASIGLIVIHGLAERYAISSETASIAPPTGSSTLHSTALIP